ncbi:hypothetical protein NIIDMKKI_15500 [Mycobacterium kansasii]|uniref:Uncharacterized protein n=1 Tax=Mycobacterium kansasii TaxID=1768 RepID=A0A7G1I7D4_MYCKA|nr:hypothetical protein NIIDMKKI_15500 [Mycobacterium kansasii]
MAPEANPGRAAWARPGIADANPGSAAAGAAGAAGVSGAVTPGIGVVTREWPALPPLREPSEPPPVR